MAQFNIAPQHFVLSSGEWYPAQDVDMYVDAVNNELAIARIDNQNVQRRIAQKEQENIQLMQTAQLVNQAIAKLTAEAQADADRILAQGKLEVQNRGAEFNQHNAELMAQQQALQAEIDELSGEIAGILEREIERIKNGDISNWVNRAGGVANPDDVPVPVEQPVQATPQPAQAQPVTAEELLASLQATLMGVSSPAQANQGGNTAGTTFANQTSPAGAASVAHPGIDVPGEAPFSNVIVFPDDED